MPRHSSTWPLLFVLLVFAGCASTQPDGVQRSAPKAWNSAAVAINSELGDLRYERTNWAVTVVDLSADEVVYQRNAATNLTPASNAKLYTTAAALDLLGPDYTYTTNVVTDGLIDNGVLLGNLYVIGSGDPVIGGQFEDDDEFAIFRSWADSLKAMGIKTIRISQWVLFGR